jgi:signal transduction histidine kinase
MVARVAERHGGRAWVEAGEREGSVFVLWLPTTGD